MKFFLWLMAVVCLSACNNVQNNKTADNKDSVTDTKKPSAASQNWHWHDSLDAINAAPESHKIVYEDTAVRILHVICLPGKEEKVHTHQHKSLMWFTKSASFMFYNYELDANNQLIKKDSTEIKGFPAEALNKAQDQPSELCSDG